jgi:4'-phosphopantetheinyl transferase
MRVDESWSEILAHDPASLRDSVGAIGEEVHLWRFFAGATEAAPRTEWNLLSSDERERANRLILPARRADFVNMRAWLRRILAAYCSCRPEEVRFEYSEHGKPQLALETQIQFNLSHSERWALLGVRRTGAIGVDVEFCRPGRAFHGISERFFADCECAWLAKYAESSQYSRHFYEIWARKEAYLKALGTGLSLSPREFAIDHRPESLCLLDVPETYSTSRAWQLRDIGGFADYAAAMCTDDAVEVCRCFTYRGCEIGG